MDDVSLTTFVDFVLKAGSPKMTVVRQWKHKPDYNPAKDFYKPLRERIVEMHRADHPISFLQGILRGLTDNKKANLYPGLIDGYKSWRGRKKLDWFLPPQCTYTIGDLPISVNPECGLSINGTPHLVKLYFKDVSLAKNRAEIIAHLMSKACGPSAPEDCVMGILDIRKSKLLTPTSPVEGLDAQLSAEAAYWAAAWPMV